MNSQFIITLNLKGFKKQVVWNSASKPLVLDPHSLWVVQMVHEQLVIRYLGEQSEKTVINPLVKIKDEQIIHNESIRLGSHISISFRKPLLLSPPYKHKEQYLNNNHRIKKIYILKGVGKTIVEGYSSQPFTIGYSRAKPIFMLNHDGKDYILTPLLHSVRIRSKNKPLYLGNVDISVRIPSSEFYNCVVMWGNNWWRFNPLSDNFAKISAAAHKKPWKSTIGIVFFSLVVFAFLAKLLTQVKTEPPQMENSPPIVKFLAPKKIEPVVQQPMPVVPPPVVPVKAPLPKVLPSKPKPLLRAAPLQKPLPKLLVPPKPFSPTKPVMKLPLVAPKLIAPPKKILATPSVEVLAKKAQQAQEQARMIQAKKEQAKLKEFQDAFAGALTEINAQDSAALSSEVKDAKKSNAFSKGIGQAAQGANSFNVEGKMSYQENSQDKVSSFASKGLGSYNQASSQHSLKVGSGFVPVKASEELFVEKGLTEKEIGQVIYEHLKEIRYCHESALLRNPGLEGKLVVKFVISPNGKVTSSQVVKSLGNLTLVEPCLLQQLKMWQFPRPKGGVSTTATYPFVFKVLNIK